LREGTSRGDFAGSHLELAIVRSIEGILRVANAGDTLVDVGSAAVALLGGERDGVTYIFRKIAASRPRGNDNTSLAMTG
jgi:hypothetical protein